MAPAFMPTSSSGLTPPIPTGLGFGTRTLATRWTYDSARASTTRFTQPEERCAPNAQAASPSRAERHHRIYFSRERPGCKGMALAQIEDGRTMGSTDPELPRPGRGRRAICNLARTILDPYVQNGQIVDAGEDRG